MTDTILHNLSLIWGYAPARIGVIIAAALAAAFFARMVLVRVALKLAGRTETEADDHIAEALRGPVFYSLLLAGAGWAAIEAGVADTWRYVLMGSIKTLAVLIWGAAAMRIGTIVLGVLSRQIDRVKWIQPRTLPLLEIVMKVLVVGGSLYFAFVAWRINVTSWLASAGIVGIAVGFAAKDTLANLFAGIFILADAPYRIGDFIILDNGIRGIVSDIGVRSTRIITRDDVEVTVPNAVIANTKIVNESSGPYQKMRVRVKVSVAYGSDVDKVREVLLACAGKVQHLSGSPEPRVRFREFGDSGLLFELLAWVDEPVYRGRVLDELNTRVYKAFAAENIEIPYMKHDLYIKEQPGPGQSE